MAYEIWMSFEGYWQIFLPHQPPGCWQVGAGCSRCWEVYHGYLQSTAMLGWEDAARFEDS